MNPVKGEDFVDWHQLLSIEEVRELSKLSAPRATLSLLSTWSWILFFYALAYSFPHPAVIIICALGLVVQQHGLAILAHQSAHYRMYQHRDLNDFVGMICGIPLLVSVVTYRMIHRIHHNNLYSPIDPDMALMAGYPKGKRYLLGKLLKDLLGLTTLKNYAYFFGFKRKNKNTDKNLLDDTSPRLRKAAKRDQKLVLASHIALASLLIGLGYWKAYLLWFIPMITVFQALLRLRAVAEHGAVRDTTSPLTAARTTVTPFLVRCWLYPHYMNYHIEHHLYPSIPHYRLARCHQLLEQRGALKNAENIEGVRQTFSLIFADRKGSLNNTKAPRQIEEQAAT